MCVRRKTASFLFHAYPESSGKGRSECEFTLGQAFNTMGGSKNKNLSFETFDEDTVNATGFEDMLKRVQSKARGKAE